MISDKRLSVAAECGRASPETNRIAAAAAFVAGALLPLLVILLTPTAYLWPALMVSTLLGLAAPGFLSARLDGAPVLPAMLRVVVWGAVAMGVTSAIGKILGVAV